MIENLFLSRMRTRNLCIYFSLEFSYSSNESKICCIFRNFSDKELELKTFHQNRFLIVVIIMISNILVRSVFLITEVSFKL